ncbi:MAG: U32 family peptidase [Campylobacter sp.]|nr:U32 family peptidase [Campylobacter sp.]
MKKPELLSPAGNYKKLQIALNYGADAVYASVGAFSLRQRSAKEFTKESFADGVSLVHQMGKKLYATVNGFPTNAQLDNIKRHIGFLNEIGVDGLLIASVGVISLAKEVAPNIPIHISTQANVMNYLDAKTYYEMGATRIVAAREMSLKDLVLIKEKLPNLEIEIFIHGSMCFAYSGRCLISAVQSGRLSNRGSCANDCRFGYELFAKNEDTGTLFKLEEDEQNGTYIMNSKDLNLIHHLEKIIQTGAIDSLKIEGRTKSEYYAGCATKAYRSAIDDIMADKFELSKYEFELNSIKNRGFTDGYLIKKPFERNSTQNLDSTLLEGTHQVHAISEDGEFISVKYKIIPNESYEILYPFGAKITTGTSEFGEIYQKDGRYYLKFNKLIAKNGKEFDAVHSGNLNEIKLPLTLPKFSFLRKEI